MNGIPHTPFGKKDLEELKSLLKTDDGIDDQTVEWAIKLLEGAAPVEGGRKIKAIDIKRALRIVTEQKVRKISFVNISSLTATKKWMVEGAPSHAVMASLNETTLDIIWRAHHKILGDLMQEERARHDIRTAVFNDEYPRELDGIAEVLGNSMAVILNCFVRYAIENNKTGAKKILTLLKLVGHSNSTWHQKRRPRRLDSPYKSLALSSYHPSSER